MRDYWLKFVHVATDCLDTKSPHLASAKNRSRLPAPGVVGRAVISTPSIGSLNGTNTAGSAGNARKKQQRDSIRPAGLVGRLGRIRRLDR